MHTPEEQAKNILRQAREYRQHLWVQHNVTDVQTTLGVIIDGEEQVRQAPEDAIQEAIDDHAAPPDAVRALLEAPRLWPDFTRYRMVAFVTDGYMTHDIPDEYRRGDMQQDFATNPESQVREACIACVAQDDLVGGVEVATVAQPYWVTDGGLLQFGEEIADDNGVGSIADVLKEAIARDLS